MILGLAMNLDRSSLVLDISVCEDGSLYPRVHLLEVSIAGAARTRMIAVIATERGVLPRLHRWIEQGSIELPRKLLERVLLLCFDRLMREGLLCIDHCDRVRVPDGLEWLERQVCAADLAIIEREVSRHIDRKNTVRDFSWLFPSPKEK